jgi:predicted regulator of Ras-like GTPase activity (Roadblock/LC7/MglB family)
VTADADAGAFEEHLRAGLEPLRDVAGIVGSFVAGRAGQVMARDLPPLFDSTALAEASHRLLRLEETFAAAGEELDVAVIRFREQKLFLKLLGGGMLCVVTDSAVNMPALRMAANLAARRIGPALDAAPPAVAARAPNARTGEATAPARGAAPGGWWSRGARATSK